MALRKKTKKEHSIVPVLFTLGVIGWGFFAIDRLTSARQGVQPWEGGARLQKTHNAPVNRDSSSWKKTIGNLLTSMGEQIDKPDAKTNDSQYLPVISENKLRVERLPGNFAQIESPPSVDPAPVADDFIGHNESENPVSPVQKDNHNGNENAAAENDNGDGSLQLFFYRENSDGSLVLTGIPWAGQNGISQTNAKEVFSRLVLGPSASERERNFIDSFPVKPTVLDVRIRGNVAVINLDDNFGHGVSFRTLDLQLKQFLSTAKQFNGVDSIQIQIYGKPVSSAGGDGLAIPNIINDSSWPMAYGQ